MTIGINIPMRAPNGILLLIGISISITTICGLSTLPEQSHQIITLEDNNSYSNENLFQAIRNLSWPSRERVSTGTYRVFNYQKKCSQIRELCQDFIKADHRLGCCKPSGCKHIYNVKIEKDKIVLFSGPSGARPCGRVDTKSLPTLMSLNHGKQMSFGMKVEVREGNFPPSDCTQYTNGTLHVFPKQTTHNLYHAMNDNILPMMSQIVLDYYFDEDYLFRKRFQMMVGGSDPDEVPHMAIIKDVIPALKMSEMDGYCFGRVIWGAGARLIYNHALVVLRRLSADLLREVVLNSYSLLPSPLFQSNPKLVDKPFSDRQQPLNVVIYSRGSSGTGRSIQGEDKLAEALIRGGARVVICCDFNKVKLVEQLSIATHADVVMGLHGAGLTNTLFARKGVITVELKTLYGYTLDLFSVITDARQGVHVQINVKNYFIKGGHRPLDGSLIKRIISGISTALRIQRTNITAEQKLKSSLSSTSTTGDIDSITQLSDPGDLIIGHSSSNGELSHILGPPSEKLKQWCRSMIFARYWLLIDANPEQHCLPCGKS